jgi:hypothetical protein
LLRHAQPIGLECKATNGSGTVPNASSTSTIFRKCPTQILGALSLIAMGVYAPVFISVRMEPCRRGTVPWAFALWGRRVSYFASAALAAIISVGPAFARTPVTKRGPTLFQIQPAQTGISLEVADATGAVITRARVTVVNEKTTKSRCSVLDLRPLSKVTSRCHRKSI